MSIETKLARWEAAGIIDAATRERIAEFERGGQRFGLLQALGGLGAITIAIGTVSIIAANWAAIGKGPKLLVDVLIGAGLAAALYRSARRRETWQTDVLALVYYGFVLASFALLGQVYQLTTPLYWSLLVWSLATLPFMTLVRGRFAGAVWFVGLAATHIAGVAELLERLRVSEALQANLAVSLGFVSVLAYFAVAGSPWMRRERPQIGAAWTSLLWAFILSGGFGLGFLFYQQLADKEPFLRWSIAVMAAVVAILHLAWPRLYPSTPPRARLGMTAILACVALTMALGLSFPRGEMRAVGALAQIALLAVAGWTSLELGRVRTFNLFTAAIALRILVIYFEVFGSMLSTGVGMISGGVLTLVLAWLWKRQSSELVSRVGGGGGHAS
jgi:uncharacterized membrane protein